MYIRAYRGMLFVAVACHPRRNIEWGHRWPIPVSAGVEFLELSRIAVGHSFLDDFVDADSEGQAVLKCFEGGCQRIEKCAALAMRN